MVDAQRSERCARKSLRVRVSPWARADVVKRYTRYLEVVVGASLWRFDSSHPHIWGKEKEYF